MKIYVAGKWTSRDKARARMRILENLGHEITHDWTQSAEDPNYPELAITDVNAVKSCDVLWLILEKGMEGAWVEVGIAIGAGKPVYVEFSGEESLGLGTKIVPVGGPYQSHCIFLCHPLVRPAWDMENGHGLNEKAMAEYNAG